MQSVPITTKVVSLNPVHGEVYSIQHYVIKFVSEVQQVMVSSTNKTDRHDIIEILLKVSLNTITLTILDFHNKKYHTFSKGPPKAHYRRIC